MSQPLFSDNFLTHHIEDFRLTGIPNIRASRKWLESFINELNSGKLESLKEEEIKSRFVTKFFGDVLGFNYGNSTEWRLREEKKTKMDGTKPDAAIGYFYSDKQRDDVRGVIEVKNAKTDLDEKQKRAGGRSPVEQAFNYAPKMGGNCKWVIVSNIKEIRFYAANDASKYQVYFITELLDETKLKELFFLFHKDRSIARELLSPTERLLETAKLFQKENDKPVHIVEELYKSIKQLNPLAFVDPGFIASMRPFNVTDGFVWHYENGVLLTLNGKIHDLLKGIKIENGDVVILDTLKAELENEGVVEADRKLTEVFEMLFRSRVIKIAALRDIEEYESKRKNFLGFSRRTFFRFNEESEGTSIELDLNVSSECDCIICNYFSFDFIKVVGKLKVAVGNPVFNTPEYAYANYLVGADNFKTTYTILKAIEEEKKDNEGEEIAYFIAKKNLKHLINLVSHYPHADRKEILADIRAIDLDKTIHNELEFSMSKAVRELLLDIKEDRLVQNLNDRIDETVQKIEALKRLYDFGGRQHSGPDLIHELTESYLFLWLHCTANSIMHDAFRDYRIIAKKVIAGLAISHSLPEHELKEFNSFFLREAILHLRPKENEEIFKAIDVIRMHAKSSEELLGYLRNICASFLSYDVFNNPYENGLLKEYLQNFSFQDKFTDSFANIFIFLSKAEITAEQFFSAKKPVLDFLKCESILSWHDMKYVCKFIDNNGAFFTENELCDLLKLAMSQHNFGSNKYERMIEVVAGVIDRIYPAFEFSSLRYVKLSILQSTGENESKSNFLHLIPLVNISNVECKKALLECFEQSLDANFNYELYSRMLLEINYDYNNKDYLSKLAEHVGASRGRAYQYGKYELTDLVFWNFSNIVYWRDIDFDRPEIIAISKLNDFESWLLNPFNFDYASFDAKWLKDLSPKMLSKVKLISAIGSILEHELISRYDQELARIRYAYFV